MRKLNPGDIAPITGSYRIVDSQGKVLDTITIVKGKRLPPTQSSEYAYEYDD